jgi:hypothetical protein
MTTSASICNVPSDTTLRTALRCIRQRKNYTLIVWRAYISYLRFPADANDMGYFLSLAVHAYFLLTRCIVTAAATPIRHFDVTDIVELLKLSDLERVYI